MQRSSHKRRARPAAQNRRIRVEQLEDRSLLAATITVTSVLDSNARDSVLTLREAILVNNRSLLVNLLSAAEQTQVSGTPTSSDTDTIAFNIPGSGVKTINLITSLPTITGPVIIDGYTQLGASANTLAAGNDAALRIELNGSQATGSGVGLQFNGATGSMVRGLVINGFTTGIELATTSATTGITIAGNFIGTDPTGLIARPNNFGIRLNAPGTANFIGGTMPADRNVVSGNVFDGIMVLSDGNTIQGNFLGTDKSGTTALPNNSHNIHVGADVGAANNQIGGIIPGARNVISGAGDAGIAFFGPGSTGNRVQGNFIGTDVTGSQPVGNGEFGIRMEAGSAGNTIGGTEPGAGNVIGGTSAGPGISFVDSTANVVQGNFIGTDLSETINLGNGGPESAGGIFVGASGNTIGGAIPAAGNRIARNRGPGIAVSGQNGPTSTSIQGNRIYANASGLGIDLSANGVTPNDLVPTADADSGPNNLQNFPEISSATLSDSLLTLRYVVPSTSTNATYPLRVEFFKADSDEQEGERFLGFSTYMAADAGVVKSAAFPPAADISVGTKLVATATDSAGNTSEFSAAIAVTLFSAANAPSGTDRSVTLLEDGVYIVSVADFGFTDPQDNPPNAFAAVRIAGLPTTGVLRVNDTPVAVGQTISAATIAAGALRYTPSANATGVPLARITFQVQDNGGTANGGADLDPTPNTLSINVTPVNDPPAGGDFTLTMFEDSMYGFGTGDFRFTDPLDSPINAFANLIILSAPTGLVLNGGQVADNQVIPVASIAARQLRYVVPPNHSGPSAAQIVFRVQDNGGTANGGIDRDPTPNFLTINITPINDPPQSADAAITTAEDTPYIFRTADFPFSDPLDSPPNQLASIFIESLPASGRLLISGVPVVVGQVVSAAALANGALQYLPDDNLHGAAIASFMFAVTDNGGVASGGEFVDPLPNQLTINVTAVNDAPSAADDHVSLVETGIAVAAPGIFRNDSDIDLGDSIQLVAVNGQAANIGTTFVLPSGVFLIVRADGSFAYDPRGRFQFLNRGQFAVDTFTYAIRDEAGAEATATVHLTIEGMNDSPYPLNDEFSTREDVPLIVAAPGVLANDLDVDSPSLTAQIDLQPLRGQVALRADGGFTYTPDAQFSGFDSFRYSVFDGESPSLFSAVVSIRVLPVNDAPLVLLPRALSVAENAPFSVEGAFVDPDFDDLWTVTVDFGAGPIPLALAADNSFQFDHIFADNGIYPVVVEVRDAGGKVGTAELLVNVTNTAPQNLSLAGPATGMRGETVTFSGSFTDPSPADTFTATIDWGDGTTSVFTSGELAAGVQFTAMHTYAASGTYPVSLRVVDDDGGAALSSPVNIVIASGEAGATFRGGVLEINGSTKNDNIALLLSGGKIVVRATYGATTSSQSFAPGSVQRIVAKLDRGDDGLKIDAKIRTPVTVDAGAGNDRVTAGGGASIIVGGDGNDLLYGGAGRDVLIGGAGKDQLWGYGGSDLLIAGSTTYDANHEALAAILAEWSSSRAFKVRAANLRAGAGPILSGSSIALVAGTTVLDDSEVDSLMGSGDSDWFFANPRRDKINDKAELQN